MTEVRRHKRNQENILLLWLFASPFHRLLAVHDVAHCCVLLPTPSFVFSLSRGPGMIPLKGRRRSRMKDEGSEEGRREGSGAEITLLTLSIPRGACCACVMSLIPVFFFLLACGCLETSSNIIYNDPALFFFSLQTERMTTSFFFSFSFVFLALAFFLYVSFSLLQ